MTFNFKTKAFELNERETGMVMLACHDRPFATGRVALALADIYSANFEQDLTDLINEMDGEADNGGE